MGCILSPLFAEAWNKLKVRIPPESASYKNLKFPSNNLSCPGCPILPSRSTAFQLPSIVWKARVTSMSHLCCAPQLLCTLLEVARVWHLDVTHVLITEEFEHLRHSAFWPISLLWLWSVIIVRVTSQNLYKVHLFLTPCGITWNMAF